jgi:hypothetical protein
MTKKLYTLSDVTSSRYDSVAIRRKQNPKGHNDTLLSRANKAWENLRKVREHRQRVLDYCYGDQWGDIIEYKDQKMTEREYIRKRGDIALTNNIMISILNSIVGLYAKQRSEPECFARAANAQELSDMMSAALQQNWQDTNMPSVLKTVFEDALVGGIMAVRETYGQADEIMDSWTDYVNPNYIFWEAGSDPRYKDLRMIGMLHDLSKTELLRQFANKRYGWSVSQLEELYANRFNPHTTYGFYGDDEGSGVEHNERNTTGNISFFCPSDQQLMRVVEVWTKETKTRIQCHDPIATSSDDALYRVELSKRKDIESINAERTRMYEEQGIPLEEVPLIEMETIQDEYWYFTYLTPSGEILCEGETPYDFHSHPFTIKLFPYVNGEIHSFMGNVIDQQRYINRLIVMHDMAARSSAKGITIVPTENIPDYMTPQDFADQFTSYDGLIFYDTARQNPNLRPEIITSNAVQIGTTELLNMELGLIRDITNVTGALQGKTPTSGTSAARYSLETQNATTALYSIFADMTEFTEELARKKVAMIKQYYPDHKYVLNRDKTGLTDFDRMSVEDVMFLISVKESAATVAFQSKVNDTLDMFLERGLIDAEMYLQNSNLPFAPKLLQSLKAARQQQMMQQQMMQQQQQMAPGGAESQPAQQAEAPEEGNPMEEHPNIYPYGGGSNDIASSDEMLAL